MQAGLEQFAAVSSIFDAAEIVVYVADMETYELLFMNSRAELLWGKNWTGQRCYKVLQAGQSAPCAFCTNSQLTDGGRATNPVVWEFQNTVTQRWYLCIDKAIPWSDGRLVRMEVAIDITERKAQEQFRDQYLGLISHDLRTPISTITIATTLLRALLDRGAGLVETARPLETIRRSARRMAAMIEDLLETTRLESGRLRLSKSHFDVGRLAEVVTAQLETTASRPIRCETSGPAPVLADSGRIERVLENLIGNALRYSPPHSPITVRVEAQGPEAIVRVVDSGIGIPTDEIPKLFQRFQRVKGNNSGAGLGLGLYNSRLIIDHHGGRIWAESTPGAGSTFGFALPTAPPAAPPAVSPS